MLVRTIPWTPEAAFAELENRFDELIAVSNRANEADTRLKLLDACCSTCWTGKRLTPMQSAIVERWGMLITSFPLQIALRWLLKRNARTVRSLSGGSVRSRTSRVRPS